MAAFPLRLPAGIGVLPPPLALAMPTRPRWPCATSSCDSCSCRAEPATMPPCHCVTIPLRHRSTTSPIPKALPGWGAPPRPHGKRGSICWDTLSRAPRAPPSPWGPPESPRGAGGGGRGGVDPFSTHTERRARVTSRLHIRRGSGAAAPLLLREASLARVVSGLGAAPADGANNSVFFLFLVFFFVFFSCFFVFCCVAGVGGRSSWDGVLVCLFVF